MKKSLLILVCFAGLFGSTYAQDGGDYKSAIGGRVGGGYYDLIAGSYKVFVTDPGAIEVNVGFRPYGITGYNWFNLSASLSYQHHFPIGSVEGLKWFVGGGVTAYNSFSSNDAYKGFGLGLFPTGGVDYKFNNIPLNVSADIRPTFSIVNPYSYYNRFYAGNGGISARYTF
ncbi:MAG: hypothetical protein KIT80_23175 [Chitinophagaceae bacterium]|nr:hypothetical protein [Chitinophagaceae bacterium]MCW5929842.1 hypothetical protein [Chitinophagaceae bacterium]